ncbi:hypothetical protein ACN2WE_21520 [Streptomyces sp. cg28]|uniref:hypothetical protein n=1 Tax=Streptomyces sp. cg28 TaxID=3403457 RepID=UPI003B21B385
MTFAPKTWIVGETVSAALLNQEIRDQFNSFLGAWSAYTPGWYAETGSAPTLGNGTLTGRYLKTGRTVDWVAQLTWGSTTAAGSGAGSENWMFGLPAAPAAGFTQRIINVDVFKSSNSLHYGGTAIYSTTNGGVFRTIVSNRADSNAVWDSVFPITFAAGDILYASGRYEAAA